MTTLYADLSHHDWDRTKGELDFRSILKATSPAICLRATYGDPSGVHYGTRHFGTMTLEAKAAGFKLLGAYHNLVKGDAASIARQVDWLRSEMDRYGSNWAMLDVERYEELVNNGYWPRWDDVQQFAARWAKVEPGRVLAFYIPKWLWEGHLGRPDLRTLPGPVVSSNYGTNPSGLSPSALYVRQGGDTSSKWVQYGGRSPEILQYGSHCQCPGASGATDVNAFRGTFTQLNELLTKTQKEDLVSMTLTKDDLAAIQKAVWTTDGSMPSPAEWPNPDNKEVAGGTPVRDTWTKVARLEKILAAVATTLGGDLVDEAAIVAGVLEGLAGKSTEEMATALRAVLSDEQVAALAAALAPAPAPEPPAPVG